MPDFDSALAEMMPLAEKAISRGIQFLALPEYCGGLACEGPRLTPPAATEASHPVLSALCDFAARNRIWIQIGSLAISVDDNRIVNRGFVVDDDGRVRSRYDKIHMFDVRLSNNEIYRESDTVTPGEQAVVTRTPWATIGHTICYDLRFPGLFRNLAHAGAEIISVPAAFTRRTGEAHWHVLNRARAIENTCFVVSACATGTVVGGGKCYGHTLVVDPWGTIVADGGIDPGVVHARLDLGLVIRTRARIPSLKHDRAYQLPNVTGSDVP